jgi:hypothetical protein
MIKFIKFVSLILLSINIASCSSLETKNIKGWLKEGTKEHREDIKESNVDYIQEQEARNQAIRAKKLAIPASEGIVSNERIAREKQDELQTQQDALPKTQEQTNIEIAGTSGFLEKDRIQREPIYEENGTGIESNQQIAQADPKPVEQQKEAPQQTQTQQTNKPIETIDPNGDKVLERAVQFTKEAKFNVKTPSEMAQSGEQQSQQQSGNSNNLSNMLSNLNATLSTLSISATAQTKYLATIAEMLEERTIINIEDTPEV